MNELNHTNVVNPTSVAVRAVELYQEGIPNTARVDACIRRSLNEHGWKINYDEGYPLSFHAATHRLLDMHDEFRFFLGASTKQIDLHGNRAKPESWYWEPTDYTGDVLWSGAFATKQEAQEDCARASR